MIGELAQLARAPALHAGGQGFESLILHQNEIKSLVNQGFFFIYKGFVRLLTLFCKLNFIQFYKTNLQKQDQKNT